MATRGPALSNLTLSEGEREHRSVQSLERSPRLGQGMEREPEAFVRTKAAEDIFESIARYLKRVNGEGHVSHLVNRQV